MRRASGQAEPPPKGTNIFTMSELEILFFDFFSSRGKNRKHKPLHLCLLHHLLEWKQNWKPPETESCSTKDKAAISGAAHLGMQSSGKKYLTLVSKVTFSGQKTTALPPS